MRPHRLSASRVHLARYCLHTMRGDVTLPRDEPGPAALRGTALHAAVEDYLRHGVLLTDTEGDPSVFRMFAAWLDWYDTQPEAGAQGDMMAGAFVTEVALMLDVGRGRARILDVPEPRRYPVHGAHEMPLTVDAVAFDEHGVACVTDWKTGSPATDHGDQLVTCALAAALAYRCDAARYRAVHVTEQTTYADEWTDLDALDLDAHLSWLRSRMAAIPGAPPVAGAHCKGHWCPLREKCLPHREWLKEHR